MEILEECSLPVKIWQESSFDVKKGQELVRVETYTNTATSSIIFIVSFFSFFYFFILFKIISVRLSNTSLYFYFYFYAYFYFYTYFYFYFLGGENFTKSLREIVMSDCLQEETEKFASRRY